MHYTNEVLDRATGDLREVSLGNWVTVTELGEQYGVGNKKVRSVLYHMGLLQSEGQHGRYRLTPHAVQQGLGKRIDKSKRSKWPFDVLSPEGQRLIAESWDANLRDLELEKVTTPLLQAASDGLARLKDGRSSEPTTQMEVCWLSAHFPTLTMEEIALLIGVERPLVSRYANLRFKQLAFAKRLRDRTDVHTSPEDVQWLGSKRSEPFAHYEERTDFDSRRVTREEVLYSLSMYGFVSDA